MKLGVLFVLWKVLKKKRKEGIRMETQDSSLTLICLVPFLSFGFFSHKISVAWIKSRTPSGCRFAAPGSQQSGRKYPWQKLEESLLMLWASTRGGGRGSAFPCHLLLWFPDSSTGAEASGKKTFLLLPLSGPYFLPHSPSSSSALFLPEMLSAPSCFPIRIYFLEARSSPSPGILVNKHLPLLSSPH